MNTPPYGEKGETKEKLLVPPQTTAPAVAVNGEEGGKKGKEGKRQEYREEIEVGKGKGKGE